MIELVYVSRAQVHFTESQLISLLEQARKNNSEKHITGLLLYDNKGTFIQALEGPEEKIDALFTKIQQDDRHCRVNLISRKSVSSRAFSDWRMGFKIVESLSVEDLPGYSHSMDQSTPITPSDKTPHIAVDLLNYFKLSEHQQQVEV